MRAGRSSGNPVKCGSVLVTNLSSHDSYCSTLDEIDTLLEHWQDTPVTRYTNRELMNTIKQLKGRVAHLENVIMELRADKVNNRNVINENLKPF